MAKWKPLPKEEPSNIFLNEYEAKDLRIVKQAIAKSFIEAKAIKERTPEAEKLIEDWVKWVFRNAQKDKKMTETDEAF